MIRAFRWYIALSKRLLKHVSFILMLVLVPLCVVSVSLASSDNHGLVTVALACDDKQDALYKSIREEFLNDTSVIHFYEAQSSEEAVHEVNSGKADSAWIFVDDLSVKAAEYTGSRNSVPICRAVFKEDTVFTRISREKLYGRLLCLFSENYAFDFLSGRVDADKDKLSDIYKSEREKYTRDFVEFSYIGDVDKTPEQDDYMTSPLRGLLCIAVTVCILSSMLLCIKEENRGMYSFLPVSGRLALHFSSCFSAGVMSGTVAVVSLCLSGLVTSLPRECMNMLLLVISTSVFACLAASVLKQIASFSWIIVISIVLIPIFCPVFLKIDGFEAVKILLPTYHYLNSVYDNHGFFCQIAYIIVSVLLWLLVLILRNKCVFHKS